MAGYTYHIGEQLDIVEAGQAHSAGGSEQTPLPGMRGHENLEVGE